MANWPMTKQQTMPSHYLADLDVEKQLISFKFTSRHFLHLFDFLTSTNLQLSDFFFSGCGQLLQFWTFLTFLRMWTTFATLDFSYFSQDVDNHQLSSSSPHFD